MSVLVGLVGPPASPCQCWQAHLDTAPASVSGKWQCDQCWEQGICLFASDLGINHKLLKLHRDKL